MTENPHGQDAASQARHRAPGADVPADDSPTGADVGEAVDIAESGTKAQGEHSHPERATSGEAPVEQVFNDPAMTEGQRTVTGCDDSRGRTAGTFTGRSRIRWSPVPYWGSGVGPSRGRRAADHRQTLRHRHEGHRNRRRRIAGLRSTPPGRQAAGALSLGAPGLLTAVPGHGGGRSVLTEHCRDRAEAQARGWSGVLAHRISAHEAFWPAAGEPDCDTAGTGP